MASVFGQFTLSFSWGGCRLARANDVFTASLEAAVAAEATQSEVNLLQAGQGVVGQVTRQPNGKFKYSHN